MSRFLKISDKQLEFPEEIKEVLYFNNLVVVLYRKDREIPNNVIISDLDGNQKYQINDIIQAKIQRGFDHIEKKNETILIAECEIGIIFEIDIINKVVIDKTFVR